MRKKLADLLRAARVNASLWTPAVGFSVTLHLLFGISFIVARLRMDMAVTAYTRMFGGLTWLVGAGFIALYALALVLPVRGAIVAVLLCALVGLIVSVPVRDPVAIVFHLALPWFAVTSTREKLSLTRWLRDRRADYEREVAGVQQTARDLAETNRDTAADLATHVRDTTAESNAAHRARVRELTRQLRAYQQADRAAPRPPDERGGSND